MLDRASNQREGVLLAMHGGAAMPALSELAALLHAFILRRVSSHADADDILQAADAALYAAKHAGRNAVRAA